MNDLINYVHLRDIEVIEKCKEAIEKIFIKDTDNEDYKKFNTGAVEAWRQLDSIKEAL
jgi:hypothetical protein